MVDKLWLKFAAFLKNTLLKIGNPCVTIKVWIGEAKRLGNLVVIAKG